MTTPRSPEGELTDIMDLDRDIEALRRGAAPGPDSALALLVNLRDDVDRRASALLGEHSDATAQAGRSTRTPATRLRRRHRLAVVPIAGALVLASTGAAAALSGSPHAPLYPLHRIIFGTAASSAGQISADLAASQVRLSHAASEPYALRAGDLAQARTLLADAKRLLPRAGADRGRLSILVAGSLGRLAQLESPPIVPSGPPSSTPPTTPEPTGTPGAEGPRGEPGAATSGGTAAESEPPDNALPATHAPEVGGAEGGTSEVPGPVLTTTPSDSSGRTNEHPPARESEDPEDGTSHGVDN